MYYPPLSAGNVVSISVSIYRANLDQFLRVSFLAVAWSFLPIYGWAKSSRNAALLSRLAFQVLIGEPETTEEARDRLGGRLWGFLGAYLVVGLLMGVVVLVLSISCLITGAFLVELVHDQPPLALGVGIGCWVVGLVFWLFAVTWVYSRFYFPELPLVQESGSTPFSAVGRSWQLTRGNVWWIQNILLVDFLVTVPVQLITQGLNLLFAFVPGIAGAVIILPLTQTIKAVTYYNLYYLQEGGGLSLDRPRETRDRS